MDVVGIMDTASEAGGTLVVVVRAPSDSSPGDTCGNSPSLTPLPFLGLVVLGLDLLELEEEDSVVGTRWKLPTGNLMFPDTLGEVRGVGDDATLTADCGSAADASTSISIGSTSIEVIDGGDGIVAAVVPAVTTGWLVAAVTPRSKSPVIGGADVVVTPVLWCVIMVGPPRIW